MRRPLRVGLEENKKFSYICWPVLQDNFFNNEESFIGDLKRLLSAPLTGEGKVSKHNSKERTLSTNTHTIVETSQSSSISYKVDLLIIRTEQERRESLAFNKNPEESSNEWAEYLYRNFIGAWLICTPSLSTFGSYKEKSINMTISFIRDLKNKHVILDQNSYRCAMLACLRVDRSDYVNEISQIMVSGGIHLNALTNGLYTQSLISTNTSSTSSLSTSKSNINNNSSRDKAKANWNKLKRNILTVAVFKLKLSDLLLRRSKSKKKMISSSGNSPDTDSRFDSGDLPSPSLLERPSSPITSDTHPIIKASPTPSSSSSDVFFSSSHSRYR